MRDPARQTRAHLPFRATEVHFLSAFCLSVHHNPCLSLAANSQTHHLAWMCVVMRTASNESLTGVAVHAAAGGGAKPVTPKQASDKPGQGQQGGTEVQPCRSSWVTDISREAHPLVLSVTQVRSKPKNSISARPGASVLAEVDARPVLQNHGIRTVSLQSPAGSVDEFQGVVLSHDFPIT